MEVAFHVVDYVIVGVFLLISLAIGVYYGVIRKQRTTEEYLFGNRQMSLVPVALSLLVTYNSGVSVVGVPAEMYLYDTMFFYSFIGIALANLIQYGMIVPLMYPLRLTSPYEYLGRRFDSRAVQLIGTFLGMIQTLLYMSIVLLAPALALEAIAGIPLWVSVVLVGVIGTIYTSLGGIKSVVWTDVFQFVILYAGLTVILVLSGVKIGSMQEIWRLAVKGGRINFMNASADPTIRHTLWGLVIGMTFNWLPNCCNQSAVQRICAMKNLKQSKIAVLLNIPLVLVYGIILCLTGVVMYAYFANEGCDPLEEGSVTYGNQVTPYFVMHLLSHLPGLAGLFIAALFSGSLSSLSSGINAMAANTIEDVLVNYLKKTSQWKQTFAAKIIVIVYGVFAVALAYAAKDLSGPVTQIALSFMGAVGGPVTGMIFLGGLFPQANWIGAIGGGVIGLGINIWVSIGSVLYGNKATKSPSVGVEGCSGNNSVIVGTDNLITPTIGNIGNVTTYLPSVASDPSHLVLYDISYLYFGLIGFIVTIAIGLIISIVAGLDRHVTSPEYIFPCMRGFWKAGSKGVQVVPKYQVYKLEQKKNGAVDSDNPVTASIKSLDLTWYNKVPDMDL